MRRRWRQPVALLGLLSFLALALTLSCRWTIATIIALHVLGDDKAAPLSLWRDIRPATATTTSVVQSMRRQTRRLQRKDHATRGKRELDQVTTNTRRIATTAASASRITKDAVRVTLSLVVGVSTSASPSQRALETLVCHTDLFVRSILEPFYQHWIQVQISRASYDQDDPQFLQFKWVVSAHFAGTDQAIPGAILLQLLEQADYQDLYTTHYVNKVPHSLFQRVTNVTLVDVEAAPSASSYIGYDNTSTIIISHNDDEDNSTSYSCYPNDNPVRVLLVTWVLIFFDDIQPRQPNNDEFRALLCQTDFFLTNVLTNHYAGNGDDDGMDVSLYHVTAQFNGTAVRMATHVAVQVPIQSSSSTSITFLPIYPDDVEDVLHEADMNEYIQQYVWQATAAQDNNTDDPPLLSNIQRVLVEGTVYASDRENNVQLHHDWKSVPEIVLEDANTGTNIAEQDVDWCSITTATTEAPIEMATTTAPLFSNISAVAVQGNSSTSAPMTNNVNDDPLDLGDIVQLDGSPDNQSLTNSAGRFHNETIADDSVVIPTQDEEYNEELCHSALDHVLNASSPSSSTSNSTMSLSPEKYVELLNLWSNDTYPCFPVKALPEALQRVFERSAAALLEPVQNSLVVDDDNLLCQSILVALTAVPDLLRDQSRAARRISLSVDVLASAKSQHQPPYLNQTIITAAFQEYLQLYIEPTLESDFSSRPQQQGARQLSTSLASIILLLADPLAGGTDTTTCQAVDDGTCVLVHLNYDLFVVPEKPKNVTDQSFTEMATRTLTATQDGIAQGLLQLSLADIDPDSPWTLTTTMEQDPFTDSTPTSTMPANNSAESDNTNATVIEVANVTCLASNAVPQLAIPCDSFLGRNFIPVLCILGAGVCVLCLGIIVVCRESMEFCSCSDRFHDHRDNPRYFHDEDEIHPANNRYKYYR